MKSSMYIGRVGALAVALGIGAAVATSPGIALADETESNSSPAGESPSSNPPAAEKETQAPGPDKESIDDSEGSGPVAAPPVMNVSASTVDTSTHDGADDSEEAESEEAESEEAEDEAPEAPADESDDPPAGNERQEPPAAGSSSFQRYTQPAPTSTGPIDTASKDVQLKATVPTVDDTAARSFTTAALNDEPPASGAETFSTLASTDTTALEAPQNPIAALISLPLRIVNGVLSAIVGGPNTPPGENPLLLGLLAFVRRQFSSISATFTNQAPDIKGYSLVENPDGTFTITVDPENEDQVADPDGDQLSFSATNGAEGTVVKTGVGTFVYTPGDEFDGEDSFTLTVSDTGGLFGIGRKTDSIVVTVTADEQDPTEPEVTQPPTQQPDGTFEAKLEFDPDVVTEVTIAEGFEPKYWTVTPVYNAETGELELKLEPTQAGRVRAALGLDTTDSLGLTVNTTQTQTIQTFALRSASFAALAGPDYTVNLPDIPAGHFEVGDPVVTAPSAVDPTKTSPAGVVVTERYAYVVNANSTNGGPPILSVIGADPEKPDYLQVIDEIEVGQVGFLVGLAGDRLYIADGAGFLSVIDTDGDDPLDEADDNTVLDPVAVENSNGALPVVSPDQKKIYLINQPFGLVEVIDVDPTSATYHTVIDSIDVADDFTVVDNGDGTGTATVPFPQSAVFNADGSRMYIVRDIQSYTVDLSTNELLDFGYSAELVTVDTATNQIVGDPVPLGERYGYFASGDGKFAYIPTLDMNGFIPSANADISQIIGGVTVVDVQDPDNPVVVTQLPAGNMPVNVAFSPDKSLAYVVDAGKGTIWLIDTANQEVLDLDPDQAGVQGLVFDTTPNAVLGQTFNVIASSPDGLQLFVTNLNNGTVIPIEFVFDE